MGGIFISYRRSDVSGYAHALHAQLTQRLGAARIFMDIDSIEPGMDFVEAIEKALDSSSVILVLIGKRWYQPERLQDPMDLVRLEISMALDRRMRIIPVFFESTLMPKPDELPETIRALTRRQAVDVSDLRFNYDVGRLIDRLNRIINNEPAQVTPALPPHETESQGERRSEEGSEQSGTGKGDYISREPAPAKREVQSNVSNDAAHAKIAAVLWPVAYPDNVAEDSKSWSTKSWIKRKANVVAGIVLVLGITTFLVCIAVGDEWSEVIGVPVILFSIVISASLNRYYGLLNIQWAVNAFKAGRWAETEEAVGWLISNSQQSRRAWAYGALGTLYSQQGKYADAEDAFRRSVSLGSENEWIRRNRKINARFLDTFPAGDSAENAEHAAQ